MMSVLLSTHHSVLITQYSSLSTHHCDIGQTPDLPATHAAIATVAPFPAWRGSQSKRCAEPGI